MSLFHHTSENTGSVTFTGEEAVLALLFLMVTADGAIAPEEEELVIAASNRMKLLRAQSIADFNAAVATVRSAIEARGRDAVFAAGIAGTPAELKPTVYALAADVAFAEGTATREEIDFLRQMQEALGIPDEFATKVVEVVKVKNGG